MRKYLAEMIGTMVLVLMGCGSAVFAGSMAGTVGAGVGTWELPWLSDYPLWPWPIPLEAFRDATSTRPSPWGCGCRDG